MELVGAAVAASSFALAPRSLHSQAHSRAIGLGQFRSSLRWRSIEVANVHSSQRGYGMRFSATGNFEAASARPGWRKCGGGCYCSCLPLSCHGILLAITRHRRDDSNRSSSRTDMKLRRKKENKMGRPKLLRRPKYLQNAKWN